MLNVLIVNRDGDLTEEIAYDLLKAMNLDENNEMKKPHLLNDEIDEVALVDDAKTERPVVGTLTRNAGSIWVLMRILHVFD